MSLRVTAIGPGATIQDGGRHGLLRFGVTPAGPMDWVAMRTANLALGNEAEAAAVEIPGGGLTVTCEERPVTVAFAGGDFSWKREGEPLPPAARVTLRPGGVLTAKAGARGSFAYLAVRGGVDVPEVMGSRSTHMRSSLGGMNGRMLAAGDLLVPAQLSGPASAEGAVEAPWLANHFEPVRELTLIRAVAGPQDDYFGSEALAIFFGEPFVLTPAADRMAYKFAGPRIAHVRDFNIVTDGVALGAVQIAGDGQPIVQMADRAPTGGYAKIAHVARADIGRLAQLRPGESCRFARVGVDEARAALLALEDDVFATDSTIRPLTRSPTTESLLATNLIGGVTDGTTPDERF
ncbi:MAG: biotin-dependent carboxyltransferase family protein [Beijerinckiaceae bacterium]|nr:biotin-dependent carboxyltransferase family protein [Beijerinckiaceae bacterium]